MSCGGTVDVQLRSLAAFIATTVDELAGEMAVYVKFLESGRIAKVNAGVELETMSVIKACVFVELMAAGEVDPSLLGTIVSVSAEDHRLGTGILRELTSVQLSVMDLARVMMILSDNTATEMCIRLLGGPDDVNARIASRGFGGLRLGGWAGDWFRALATSMDASGVYKGLSDAEIARRGYPLTDKRELLEARRRFGEKGDRKFGIASAEELGRFLEWVWLGRYASQAASQSLLDVMRAVEQKSRLGRFLDDAEVFNKSGSFFPHVTNDAGIVRPLDREPFVIVILINKYMGRLAVAEDAIGAIAERCVWAARPVMRQC